MPRVTILCIITLLLTLQVLGLVFPGSAQPNDEFIRSEIRKLADDSRAIRKAAVMTLAMSGDVRVEAILESFKLGELYLWNNIVVLCKETFEDEDYNEFCRLADVLTGEAILDANGEQYEIPVEELQEIAPSRAERKLTNNAKFLVRLSSPDKKIRMSGAKKCGDPPGIVESVSQLEEMSESDPVKKIRYIAKESLLLIRLNRTDPESDLHAHLAIVRELGK